MGMLFCFCFLFSFNALSQLHSINSFQVRGQHPISEASRHWRHALRQRQCVRRGVEGVFEHSSFRTGTHFFSSQDDLKADGVFIDSSNNWTCGKWDGFVALQAVAKLKMIRGKCVYVGSIQQGQR